MFFDVFLWVRSQSQVHSGTGGFVQRCDDFSDWLRSVFLCLVLTNGRGTILYERQGGNLNYVFMYTDLGFSLQAGMRFWAWDRRNETSYEETLHVAIAFNCAYYDLFYDVCFILLFSDLRWESVKHRGWA